MLFRAAMALSEHRHWRPVRLMAAQPAAAQLSVLRTLLSVNRNTRFGREHRFAEIRDHADFARQVPVHDYEMLRPYIDEQRRTGATSLTAESPLFYSQTSGTTGTPKLIPVTPTMLAIHRDEQALFSYLQYRACPSAFAGKALGIMGAAVEGHLDSGHSVGSVSGHLYRSMPAILRSRFVVPVEVSEIADYTLKYLVIVRLALGEPDVTYLGSPNPTTFLRLLEILNDHRDLLRESLETGDLPGLDALDPSIRNVVARRIRSNRARARQLAGSGLLTYSELWPRIRLVTTWTGGSCGISLDKLRQKLPLAAAVMELGYQATEGRGSIALEPETPGGLPPLHHHFFEFVEQMAWDNGRPEFLTLAELRAGGRYYILMTTAAGLYRYFMNDLVEVTAFFGGTPTLRFVQKGKGVTSLTGEKLYETQAIEAVHDVMSRHCLSSTFFLLVADESASAYRLWIELDADSVPDASSIEAAVDLRLGQLNIEYLSKRASGRLRPLAVSWLRRGTGEAYKAACIRAGQREGQFKPTVLQYRRDLKLPVHQYFVE